MPIILIDDTPAGIITLADSIRETSAKAIAMLKEMNIKSFLFTGDNEKVAAAVAQRLGMNGYLANVLLAEIFSNFNGRNKILFNKEFELCIAVS